MLSIAQVILSIARVESRAGAAALKQYGPRDLQSQALPCYRFDLVRIR
jgi:hypothetical protein